MTKGNRVRYSRWDGSQVGFELDADDVFGEITDDLLYHGDLNAALRRMMQSGFRDQNGERVQGIREMLEKIEHDTLVPQAARCAETRGRDAGHGRRGRR